MCDANNLLHHHHHGPEFILDTPVMRDFIADVQAAIARNAGRPVEEAIADLRPRFAELMVDQTWLPERYMADAPESGMGGGIGQWALYRAQDGSLCFFSLVVPPGASTPIHDHRAWGLIGLYRGTQDEDVYALDATGHAHLRTHNELETGAFFALIPPDDDVHQITTTSDMTSVSLHLLTNDTGCIWRNRYDAETGAPAPFRSGYVNVECPPEHDHHTHAHAH